MIERVGEHRFFQSTYNMAYPMIKIFCSSAFASNQPEHMIQNSFRYNDGNVLYDFHPHIHKYLYIWIWYQRTSERTNEWMNIYVYTHDIIYSYIRHWLMEMMEGCECVFCTYIHRHTHPHIETGDGFQVRLMRASLPPEKTREVKHNRNSAKFSHTIWNYECCSLNHLKFHIAPSHFITQQW